MLGLEHPLALAAAAVLVAALAARRRRVYARLYGFWSPMVEVLGLRGRRGGRALALLEAAVLLVTVFAAAQPYVTRKVVVSRDVTADLRDALKVARPVVVVLFDVSGSMGGVIPGGVKIEVAKRALKSFLDALPGNVDVALIAFSDVVGKAVAPTGDRRLVESVLESLRAGGGTMYTYPLEAALNYVKPYRAFNATAVVVLVTDGLPADRGRYDGILEELRRMHVPVYTIYIGPGGDAGEAEARRIAELTGGREYTAGGAAELAEALGSLASEARQMIVKTRVRVEVREVREEKLSLSWPLAAAAALVYAALLYVRQRRVGVTF